MSGVSNWPSCMTTCVRKSGSLGLSFVSVGAVVRLYTFSLFFPYGGPSNLVG